MELSKKQKQLGGRLANFSIAIQSYSGYAVSSIMILFLTAKTSQNGLGLSMVQASAIVGLNGGLNYLGSLIGGYISDKYLGIQKSLVVGTFLTSVGYTILFFSKAEIWNIWLGLSILIIAGAFFKGQIGAIVGQFYSQKESSEKDRAYSLFYTFTNIGSTLGPIIAGLISDKWFSEVNNGEITTYGYKYVFLVSAVLMFLLCTVLYFASGKYFGEIGKKTAKRTKDESNSIQSNTKLTNKEKNRLYAMGIIFVFVVLFWTAYFQTQTSFSILTQNLVNRTIFGFTVPVPWLISFNGILCVILGPLLGKFWMKLSNTKRGDLSTPSKMSLGMILTGVSFLILTIGVNSISGSGKMSINYMLVTYILLTVGELCLSPIGMSLFSKLAPDKYSSLAMGVWYTTFFIASILSGKLAGFTSSLGYSQVFVSISTILIVFGIILWLLRNKIVYLMDL